MSNQQELALTTVKKLKERGQDFEWYPTTQEIIDKVTHDVEKHNDEIPYYSRGKIDQILDIGAGNGKVLNAFPEHFTKYAIEKAGYLRDKLNHNIIIIGTDFDSQTLVDKHIDCTFCNPPYKEYIQWTSKIIQETNSALTYLVIPDRWKDNQQIQAELKKRHIEFTILGNYSFENSEDRKARCVVDLIKLTRTKHTDDSFHSFFKNHFKSSIEQKNNEEEQEESIESKVKYQVTKGKNYIDSLVNLYNADIQILQQNFKSICSLDTGLLKELGIENLDQIIKSLSKKIETKKDTYWKELFNNFSSITNKIIESKRKVLFEILTKNSAVDFNKDNIHAIVMWVIKNANQYVDEQLVEVYTNLTTKKGFKEYKSNTKIFEENKWKYEQNFYNFKQDAIRKNKIKYSIDYRIVLDNQYPLETMWESTRLKGNASNTIQDLLTVARCLGYESLQRCEDFEWYGRVANEFMYKPDPTKEKTAVLLKVTPFKNGNMHIHLNQKLSQHLNIEIGRILGWIHQAKDAKEEMNIKESDAQKFFDKKIEITINEVPQLTN